MLLVGCMLYIASIITWKLGFEDVGRNENYLEEINMTTTNGKYFNLLFRFLFH